MLHAVTPPGIARVGPEDHEKRQRKGCDREWLVEYRHNIFWRPVRRPSRLQTTEQLRSVSNLHEFSHDVRAWSNRHRFSVSKDPGKHKFYDRLSGNAPPELCGRVQ